MRWRERDPMTGTRDFNWTMRRRSSSEKWISASPPSEKRPRVRMMGLTTMVLKVPAGTVIRSLPMTWMITGFPSAWKYRSRV